MPCRQDDTPRYAARCLRMILMMLCGVVEMVTMSADAYADAMALIHVIT